MIDRRKDTHTRDRIDEVLARVDDNYIRYLRFSNLVGVALASMVLILTVSLGLNAVLLKKAANQRHALEGVVTRIQFERVRNIREGCESQNQRHDSTLIELDRQLLLALHAKPAGHKLASLDQQMKVTVSRLPANRRSLGTRLLQTRTFTGLLIDALVPHRNCRAVVASQVSSPPKQ